MNRLPPSVHNPVGKWIGYKCFSKQPLAGYEVGGQGSKLSFNLNGSFEMYVDAAGFSSGGYKITPGKIEFNVKTWRWERGDKKTKQIYRSVIVRIISKKVTSVRKTF